MDPWNWKAGLLALLCAVLLGRAVAHLLDARVVRAPPPTIAVDAGVADASISRRE